MTNLAYAVPGLKTAAVIGVGGGRDLLSARLFGVPEVVGVEINPIFIDLLTRHFADYTAIGRVPGISFEVDEARSWFARTGRSFDLLQMSLIDTWAATGAGAFTLSENGLYTVEAWRIFLERLTPDGVFTVSRWYAPGEVNETGRMISLAVATLQDLGAVEPKRHLFVAASETVATLVMSRKPLSAPALAALAGGRRDLRFPRSPQPRDRGGLAAPAGHRCGDRSHGARAGGPRAPISTSARRPMRARSSSTSCGLLAFSTRTSSRSPHAPASTAATCTPP